MSNNSNDWLIAEVLGWGPEFTERILPEEVPELQLRDPAVPGSADKLIKKLLFVDLLKDFCGEEIAIEEIQPAEIPDVAGYVPAKRPKGSTPERQKKIKEMVSQLPVNASDRNNQLYLESLTNAIEAYVLDSIWVETKQYRN